MYIPIDKNWDYLYCSDKTCFGFVLSLVNSNLFDSRTLSTYLIHEHWVLLWFKNVKYFDSRMLSTLIQEHWVLLWFKNVKYFFDSRSLGSAFISEHFDTLIKKTLLLFEIYSVIINLGDHAWRSFMFCVSFQLKGGFYLLKTCLRSVTNWTCVIICKFAFKTHHIVVKA